MYYRYIDKYYSKEPKKGDILPNSYIWNGDTITDDELPGTCVFQKRSQVEQYAKWSHGCGWIVEVTGEVVAEGELPGELIIKNALIIEIHNW